MERHLERELKFDVPGGWQLPDAIPLAPEGGTVRSTLLRLDSTYFDTREHDLLRSGITFRRRSGDDDTGWHLKVPSGADRNELRVPLTDDPEPPAELAELLRGITGGRELVPVAMLHTERHVHAVFGHGGNKLVEFADDEVRASVEAGEPSIWHEVEVELYEGDHALLARAAKWLRRSGAVPARSGSKLGRALGPAEPAARDARTLGGLVADYLHEQHRVIVEGDLDLRQGADVVHRTRVATRRFRSVLRVFADLVGPQASTLDEELKWYATRLGAARDVEVMRAHLREQVAALPAELSPSDVGQFVDGALDDAAHQAWAELRATLAGERYALMLREVRRVTEDVRSASARPRADVERYVRAAGRKARRRLRATRNKHVDDARRHRARKAQKRARYVAELAEPALGKAARRRVKAAKRAQTRLGELQDAVVAADYLASITGAESRVAFALGVLWSREQERAVRARRTARKLARRS